MTPPTRRSIVVASLAQAAGWGLLAAVAWSLRAALVG